MTVETLKRLAKAHKKDFGTTHAQALDYIARYVGFENWALLMASKQTEFLPR